MNCLLFLYVYPVYISIVFNNNQEPKPNEWYNQLCSGHFPALSQLVFSERKNQSYIYSFQHFFFQTLLIKLQIIRWSLKNVKRDFFFNNRSSIFLKPREQSHFYSWSFLHDRFFFQLYFLGMIHPKKRRFVNIFLFVWK